MRLDVPHSPVHTPEQLLSDPHLQQVGFFEPAFDRPTPMRRNLRMPIKFGGVPTTKDRPPPALGADTRDVLAQAGLSEAEIAAATVRRG
jgi:crotonobetainyl-CoA:carnitine CoA-transferase CaiB-like acyl-CoA transferase